MSQEQKKSTFFFRNLFRGLIWLAVILGIFLLFKKFVDVDYFSWLAPVYDNPAVIYIIYLISEIVVGIIPPEVFMIWALRSNDISRYITIIALLAVISYLAGIIGYFVGRYLNTTLIFRFLRRKLLGKSEKLLNIYGLYLIIVAALTPVPFSGVAMLVGSVRYPFKKYLFFSLTRFIRYAIYSWIIWEANTL
ncbi:MAG TPA: VTT domain-containing protein [Bacteroidales bacterium]|nr:VTT domain-containing protein [Bacteroidales bacterium]